jgi:hypothetical protein
MFELCIYADFFSGTVCMNPGFELSFLPNNRFLLTCILTHIHGEYYCNYYIYVFLQRNAIADSFLVNCID